MNFIIKEAHEVVTIWSYRNTWELWGLQTFVISRGQVLLDFGDPLTFPLVSPWGSYFFVIFSIQLLDRSWESYRTPNCSRSLCQWMCEWMGWMTIYRELCFTYSYPMFIYLFIFLIWCHHKVKWSLCPIFWFKLISADTCITYCLQFVLYYICT